MSSRVVGSTIPPDGFEEARRTASLVEMVTSQFVRSAPPTSSATVSGLETRTGKREESATLYSQTGGQR